jgi:myo-inositol 2-dehydrogenase/D-chiro-inositol 1-dehydrogenase
MHADLIDHRIEGAELAGVFDVVSEAATTVASLHGVHQASSAEELIASDDVDAVAICTNTDTHVELMISAARAGKATFCEKPIALDLKRVDEALEEANQAGVALHVGFNRRFDPSHRAVHDAVAAGDLGDLHLVRITSRDPAPPPLAYIATSGGLFLDMTIHDFDMARFISGSEVVEVDAHGAARVDPAIGEAGDIDTAAILLTHADGCLTMIDNSRQAVYGYDQRVEAFGSGGMISSQNAPANAAMRFDADGGHLAPIAYFFLDRYTQSYVVQWDAFVAAVTAGEPPPVSGLDGRAPLVIGLAAKRSLDERRRVAISEIEG